MVIYDHLVIVIKLNSYFEEHFSGRILIYTELL